MCRVVDSMHWGLTGSSPVADTSLVRLISCNATGLLQRGPNEKTQLPRRPLSHGPPPHTQMEF